MLPSHLFVIGKGEPKSQEGTTQGDPIVMGLYALGITPLMKESRHHSSSNPFYNFAFADDFTGCWKLESLKQWFREICRIGPFIGYHVKPTETWLIVKDHELGKAFRIFAGIGIKITSECRRHLEGVIGTNDNKNKYIDKKIDEWCKETEVLSTIAATEYHAAFAGFIVGLKHRYTYFMTTIPNILQNLKWLEKNIRNYFIKSLFNGYECNDMERELPTKYGGLEIINSFKISDCQYRKSRILTQERSQLIKSQHGIKCENSKQYQDTLIKIKQTLENVRSRLTCFLFYKQLSC